MNEQKRRTIPSRVHIVFSASILILIILQIWLINFTVDDPFISARYARNLVNGQGLVYNAGERVEGYSNFLWVLVLAAGMKLGVSQEPHSILLFAKMVGAFFSIASICLLAKISVKLAASDNRDVGLLDTVAVIFVSISFWFAAWAVGGLETHLYVFLLLCAAWFYFSDEIPSGVALSGLRRYISLSSLCYGLAGLTRPEFFFLFAGSSLHRLWLYRSSAEPFRKVIRWFAPAFLICLIYFMWRHQYYGYWLPNTVYAKSMGGFSQYTAGFRYLIHGISMNGLAIPLFLAFMPMLESRPKAWYTFAMTQVFAQSAFIVLAGGDWMYGFRMMVPLLPFAALCLQEGVRTTVDDVILCIVDRSVLRRAVLVFVPVILLSMTAHIYSSKSYLQTTCPGWSSLSGKGLRMIPENYYAAGMWMKKHVDRSDLVALGEAGIVPYIGEFRVLDCLGLMDTHIAHLKGTRSEKFDLEYVISKKPDYLLLFGYLDKDGNVLSNFNYVNQLTGSPYVRNNYRFVKQFDHLLVFKHKSNG